MTRVLLASETDPRALGPHVTRTMLPWTSGIEAHAILWPLPASCMSVRETSKLCQVLQAMAQDDMPERWAPSDLTGLVPAA